MTAQPTEDLPDSDVLSNADSGDKSVDADRELPPGTPRWVKVMGIIAVVLLLAFAGLHLTGNAPTHMPGSSGAQHDPPQAP